MATSNLPISLAFSCRNLPKNAMAGVRIAVGFVTYDRQNCHEVYQSETVRFTVEPVFVKSCDIDYRFAEIQRLKIIVFEVNQEDAIVDNLGEIFVDLSEIVCSRNSLDLPLDSNSDGYLSIRFQPGQLCNAGFRLQFVGRNLSTKIGPRKIAPYFTLQLILEEESDRHLQMETNSAILLYKSEIQHDENPVWKNFVMPGMLFERFRRNTVEIICWNQTENLSDELLGRAGTTLAELSWGVGTQNVHKLLNPHRQNPTKERGTIELTLLDKTGIHSFLDYIQAGTQIHFTVAVDFTASNGKPTDAKSLHFIHPHTSNDYMIALRDIGSVIEKYSRTRKMVGLGFGAQVPPDFYVSHAFFMNGSHDPHVEGVDELLTAYRKTLLAIRPFAPTEFAPVIHHVAKFAKASSRQGFEHYFVLLILTDGCVSDEQRTMEAIVEASTLPMSIIVLGIGQTRESEDGNNFSSMKKLQSTELKTKDGRKLMRDVFKFAQFKDVTGAQILDRIPMQLQQWAIMEQRKPGTNNNSLLVKKGKR